MSDHILTDCSVKFVSSTVSSKGQNNPLSALAKYLVLAALWLGSPLNAMAASVGCDDSFVQLLDDEIVIEVTPTHSNDSNNIQCALDVAASAGVPVVRLRPATYFISLLIVENFKGTFEGRTQAKTIIEVLDESILCDLMNENGLHATAIKFIKGEPRVRFMTIRAKKPCASGGPLRALLHFTGDPTKAGTCENDVIFAAVDRVTVERTSPNNNAMTGVAVYPEGKFLGGCKLTLLGTFKLNRSIINNTHFGIVTSMRSGAQVDINFNEFRGITTAIGIFDSNQNTTIINNEFIGDTKPDSNFVNSGVRVTNTKDNPPKSTRVVINNNTFTVDRSVDSPGGSEAISISFFGEISTVSAVITNNEFNLSGDAVGVDISDTSNAHVSANRFNGSGQAAIEVWGTNIPASNVTITANKGLSTFSSANGFDFVLTRNTSECVVGANQGALVFNKGTNNTVLPQN